MIHKVNRPASLSLVSADSSQGSGLFYDGPQSEESPELKSPEASGSISEEKQPKLAVVTSVEQVGMTEVVRDFYEHKQETPAVNRAGLTTKYASDSSPAKGLLLNKKAE